MYEEFKGIGRYWNLLARKLGRAKPPGITCSFLIFLSLLPSALQPISAKLPFYIYSPFSPPSAPLSFSRDMPRCSSVRIHLSLPRLSDVCIQGVVERGYIRGKTLEIFYNGGISIIIKNAEIEDLFHIKSLSQN